MTPGSPRGGQRAFDRPPLTSRACHENKGADGVYQALLRQDHQVLAFSSR